MKNNTLIFYMLMAGSIFSMVISCNSLIEVDSPKSQLTNDNIYTDDNSAIAVISNIYTWFENFELESNLMPYINLYSDEVYPTRSNSEDLMYYNNAITVDDYSNANVWKYAYFIIYECNAILKGLPHSPGVSSNLKEQLIGEAKFLRAFAYFFLVNLYGDVPLVLSTNIKETASLPRVSTVNIYKQIIQDLSDAETKLSETYPEGEKTRANKWCAASLLARVYLYMDDWKNAEAKSDIVIASGQYSLDELSNVFFSDSKETILQCWQQNGYTNIGSKYIPTSATELPHYIIDSSLLLAFKTGDRRKKIWLDSVEISGNLFYYPYKYKLRSTGSGNKAEYTILLRLSEQYLIHAEACAQQNKIAKAINDLDTIRLRAGLDPLPVGLSQVEVLTSVAEERRVELFTEWGQRFFDLKRTGKINDVLGKIKPGWEPRLQFYPIPQNELNNNPYLTQNAGY